MCLQYSRIRAVEENVQYHESTMHVLQSLCPKMHCLISTAAVTDASMGMHVIVQW